MNWVHDRNSVVENKSEYSHNIPVFLVYLMEFWKKFINVAFNQWKFLCDGQSKHIVNRRGKLECEFYNNLMTIRLCEYDDIVNILLYVTY